MRRDDRAAGRSQQPSQAEREQDGVVELAGDRDQVGNEVDRADEEEQERGEREPHTRRGGDRAARGRALIQARRRGRECLWGFVTRWEPPRRVVLSWHLTPEYEFDPDADKASEVEVRFTAYGAGTLVELEHRGFEKRAEGRAVTREKVSAEGGWGELLETYARAV